MNCRLPLAMKRTKGKTHHCLELLVIHEIIMDGSQLFSNLNTRLCEVIHDQIKMTDFGNVSNLAAKDLYQLSSVLQSSVCYCSEVLLPSQFAPIAWDDFQLHLLYKSCISNIWLLPLC